MTELLGKRWGPLWPVLLLLVSIGWSGNSAASSERNLYQQLGLAGKLDRQTFQKPLSAIKAYAASKNPS